MKTLSLSAILAVAVIPESILHAQESDGGLRGIGYATCSKLSLWAENPLASEAIVNWIHGYWSAENQFLHDSGKPMKNIFDSTVDPMPLKAQLVAICKDEADLVVVLAAQRIFERLPDAQQGNQP